MKITPVVQLAQRTYSAYNYNSQKQLYLTQRDVFVKEKQIAFTSNPFAKKISDNLVDKASRIILSKYSKFGLGEYLKLNNLEKLILSKKSAGFQDYAYDATLDGALLLKKYFDKKYGIGKYVFISIGRSLETIKEAMGYMGANTCILPISQLHNKRVDISDITCQKGFGEYLKYLEKTGIDAKTINNSDKHFIFGDYCSSGATLETVKNLLTSPQVGIDETKAEFIDFMELYKKLWEKVRNKSSLTIPTFMDMHLDCEYFKYFSSTDALPYYALEKVNEAVNMRAGFEAKLFNFRLIKKIIRD